MPELKAFLFGVALAAAIGPIALLIVNIAAAAGLKLALRSAFGAAVADLTYALIGFSGAGVIRTLSDHRALVTVIASCALALVGLAMIVAAFRTKPSAASADVIPATVLRAPFSTTFAATLANPLGIVTFAGLAAQLPFAASPLRMAWYAICLFAGSTVVQVALALTGSGARRFLTPSRLRWLNASSGAAIIAFAIWPLVVSPS